jgi:hypothetical protein
MSTPSGSTGQIGRLALGDPDRDDGFTRKPAAQFRDNSGGGIIAGCLACRGF